ncbi:hypothetical protein O6H91_02G110300 [Diphasiastrum complanatum]|uniref:Uncharacterized protein n=1 Tax=Diphasiastrum complanatum TaxID=34168 RepID=A0ACC2EJ54_DIPCM|nr:hypothetical protein O6H91_02G110300 [Diphasiastrum complanatum]
MVDAKDESTIAEAIDSVADKVHDLPASRLASAAEYAPQRLFGRQRSVHELFGSGIVADILLWRKKHLSIGLLVGATLSYIFFEWAGYTFLSVVSNTLLLLLVILFVWSNLAALLNRPPPPVPNIQLSEETVHKVALALHKEISQILAMLRDVSLGRDLRLFLKVVFALYLLSVVGGWVDFLTLGYIGIVAGLTLPVLYNKYEDEIDKYLHKGVHEAKKQYRKIDELVLSKIPRAPPKGKKVQ